MKIGASNNFHLTYCTNIHPGEEWERVFANLEQYISTLKARLAPGKPFGIGLRLADVAARELLQGNTLEQFQSWLRERNLYVFTLNGFPFGGFHHQVVKDKVYAPDWSERSRFDYTLRLVKILAALLPEGMDGGISTLPLSYKPWRTEDEAAWIDVFKESSINLALVTAEQVRIHNETGKLLHLDLEPEPDGLLENTSELINFFDNWLLPFGGKHLAQNMEISLALAEEKLREHIRLCYDTCHFAVEYEDPASVFARLQAAAIKIGKIQLSAAIGVALSSDNRDKISDRLRPFAESTYLHQVIERWQNGTLHHYNDLETALPHLEKSSAQEWRIHFHVPIFIRNYQFLQSTQDDLVAVLNLLQDNPVCNHLEIETYTWDVLPPQMKLDLLASIEREYEWVLKFGNW
jgi:sugar phosphate isomerase/epimerase